jgi:type IV secretory pathway component VirB8
MENSIKKEKRSLWSVIAMAILLAAVLTFLIVSVL